MTKLKEIHGKAIKSLLIIILLVPFFILILPFSLLIEFINGKLKKIRVKKFCKKAAGNYFLICSKRHNWYDYIQNNIIPVLPSIINVVWYKRNASLAANNTYLSILDIPGVYGGTKPLLLTVLPDHINVKSLNEDFKILRYKICKDEKIMEKARIIIEEKLKTH